MNCKQTPARIAAKKEFLAGLSAEERALLRASNARDWWKSPLAKGIHRKALACELYSKKTATSDALFSLRHLINRTT